MAEDLGSGGGSVAAFDVWIDAQLPPALAVWLRDKHHVSATHVEQLRLLSAADSEIFSAASRLNGQS